MRTDLGEIFIHIFLDIGSIHNLLRLAVLHNENSRCLHDAVLCGKMMFKIIEVTDDSIRVATAWALSEAELADMLGCLKNHLTAEQIAKFIGEPKLLEEALVARFFGDNLEHIAFRAAKDLFA